MRCGIIGRRKLMASFTKRTLQDGSVRWLAQIRKKGYKTVNITKLTKKSAENEARKIELAMENKTWDEFAKEEQNLGNTQLEHFINKYLQEITPRKTGAAKGLTNETSALKQVLRTKLGKMDVYHIKSGHIIEELRNKWEEQGNKPATIHRKLTTLQHVFSTIIQTWKHSLPTNPVSGTKPSMKQKKSGKMIQPTRNRTLNQQELQKIRTALQSCKSPYVRCVFELALETALRRRELLENTWDNVKLEDGFIKVPAPIAKSREERDVSLTPRALEILSKMHEKQIIKKGSSERIFPMTTKAFDEAWKRARKRSGVKDFQFRDTRHIAITMMANAFPKMQDLARQSGHEKLETLLIYYAEPIQSRVKRLHEFHHNEREKDNFSLSEIF